MSANATTAPIEDAVSRGFLSTHNEIELLLQRLCDEVEGDVRPAIEHTWDALERLLLTHFGEEELYLFPALEREDRAEHDALARDHAEMRRVLAEIGIGIELHSVRLETIQDLAKRLNAHAAREDRTLYRWAERSASPGPRSLVARLRRRFAARAERA